MYFGNPIYKVNYGTNKMLYITHIDDVGDFSKKVGNHLSVPGVYSESTYKPGRFYAYIVYYTHSYRGMIA